MNRHEMRAQAAIARKGQGRPLAGRGPKGGLCHKGQRRGFNPKPKAS